jgi:tyrosine-protein phosphatase YwqE
MLSLLRRLFGGDDGGIRLGPRDCHCHVIPGVDDGSRTMDESMAILRLLANDGVQRVIATPHIYPGRFPNEPEPLRAEFDAVQRARDQAGIAVELELGAEHWLDDSLPGRIADDRVLAFGPERYVLFETTTGPHAPPRLLEVAHALVDRGYTPLVAHVERYAYLRDDDGVELLEDLRAAGARFQVNRTVGRANRPGHGTRGIFIAKLQERGWIDEVGSDLHRPTAEGRPYSPAPQTTRTPANSSP